MNNIGKADLELLKELYPKKIEEMLKKVNNHYPIQYLIGYVDFYNCKIKVNENVLIPRFETELLIEKTINYLKFKNVKSIIDICSGSGCIAIALAKALNVEIDACDISRDAIKLARSNAMDNNAIVNFMYKDIFKDTFDKKYDCIISNPPYVLASDYVSVETKYEPSIAIYSKDIEFYEQILKLSKNCLNQHGIIIFEIRSDSKDKIVAKVLENYPNALIKVEKDFNNYDRFMFIET